MNDELLTIQQVGEATNLSVHTLRYYERIGLIFDIDRASNGHRRYTQDDIGWINFLMKLRATGMSIQEMQRYANLQCQGDETLPQRVEMLRTLRGKVEERMSELQDQMSLLNYKISVYSEIVEQNAEVGEPS